MDSDRKIVPPEAKLIEVINKYILPDLLRKSPNDFYMGEPKELKAKSE